MELHFPEAVFPEGTNLGGKELEDVLERTCSASFVQETNERKCNNFLIMRKMNMILP